MPRCYPPCQGKAALRHEVPRLLDTTDERLPERFRQLLQVLWQQLGYLQEQEVYLRKQLEYQVKQIEPCRRLLALEGVDPIGAFKLWLGLGDGLNSGNGVAVYRKNGLKEVVVGRDDPKPEGEFSVIYDPQGNWIDLFSTKVTEPELLLEVFDLKGHRVADQRQRVAPGNAFRFRWFRDGNPAGMYLYRISGRQAIQSGRLILR